VGLAFPKIIINHFSCNEIFFAVQNLVTLMSGRVRDRDFETKKARVQFPLVLMYVEYEHCSRFMDLILNYVYDLDSMIQISRALPITMGSVVSTTILQTPW
jgi:hypothetical protein